MNEYQEALDFAKKHLDSRQDLEKVGVLQELVDKAIPKKLQKEYLVDGAYYICPSCGGIVEYEFYDPIRKKSVYKCQDCEKEFVLL